MKKRILKLDSFLPDGKTKFCFLFGSNISHSLSPKMHTKWMQINKLNNIYLPIQIKEEKDFINFLNSLLPLDRFLGGNITLPYKTSVLNLSFLKQSETVKAIKAANTIYKNIQNQWCLENTDIKGIETSILKLIKPAENYQMIILGGGGAAAACAYHGMMNKHCTKIICLTRSPEKTLNTFDYFKNISKLYIKNLSNENIQSLNDELNHSIEKKLLINTLPMGIIEKNKLNSYSEENKYALKILSELDSKKICYFDLVYEDTIAIKFAKSKKIKCVNGKLMLVTQAKESFFLWTGIKIKD